MAFLSKLKAQLDATRAQFETRSWWPEYLASFQGGAAGVNAFFNSNPAGRYADYDEASRQLVGSAVAAEQHKESDRQLFGVIPVSPRTYERIGNVAGNIATVGLAAGAVYAGGLATGVFSSGAAATEATLAAGAAGETAAATGTVTAASGGAAASGATLGGYGSVVAAEGGGAAVVGGGGGILSGITATTVATTAGLVNTATNLLRRFGINIGGSSPDYRAPSPGMGNNFGAIYPQYLEGTGPSLDGFGLGGDEGKTPTLRDLLGAGGAGLLFYILAAALVVGGIYFLRRRMKS